MEAHPPGRPVILHESAENHKKDEITRILQGLPLSYVVPLAFLATSKE